MKLNNSKIEFMECQINKIYRINRQGWNLKMKMKMKIKDNNNNNSKSNSNSKNH